MTDIKINIIVPEPHDTAREAGDDFEAQVGFVEIRKVSVSQLNDGLADLRESLMALVTSAKETFDDDVKPESISIGLALSANGSIGVASAGAEVSIELTFRL